jgi:hypothetical protein
MDKETYNDPSEVAADKGKVSVTGPDSVDVVLTPDAALETGERLISAAAEATGQARTAEIDHRPK